MGRYFTISIRQWPPAEIRVSVPAMQRLRAGASGGGIRASAVRDIDPSTMPSVVVAAAAAPPPLAADVVSLPPLAAAVISPSSSAADAASPLAGAPPAVGDVQPPSGGTRCSFDGNPRPITAAAADSGKEMKTDDATEPPTLPDGDDEVPTPLGLQTILIEARQRFLSPEEIQAILNNYQGNIELQRTPVKLPASGSLFLFDKDLVPKFRIDGYSWERKFRGDINESYKNLKIDGQDVICSRRARVHHDPDFERITYYSLIDKSEKNIVMVHYLRQKAPGVKTSEASRVKSPAKRRRSERGNQASSKQQKADLVIDRKIEQSFFPCFVSGSFCNEECKCYNCLNTEEYEEDLDDAIAEAVSLDESAFDLRNNSVSFVCDCVGDNCLKRYCLCCKERIMGSSGGTCLNLDIQEMVRKSQAIRRTKKKKQIFGV